MMSLASSNRQFIVPYSALRTPHSPPLARNLHQRPHEYSARAAVGPRFCFFDERRTGDVEVHPRFLFDELLEELGGADCSAPASFADVLDVGDFAFDLLVVLREHRQLPTRFTAA